MRSVIQKVIFIILLSSSIALAISAAAQTFTTLVNFTGSNGGNPQDALVQGSDGNFYGTTYYGGLNQAMSLIVRGVRSAHEIAPEISWIIHDLDPDAVITDVQALAQVREDSLAPRRNTAVFFSIFAVLALAITASGISGLMTLEVTERKHEIGIRMALGASPGRVMSVMMARGLLIIVAGLGVGFAIAWLMSATMSRLIYGILPRDSVTFAVSSLVLIVIATASSFLPLTRIPRLDPTILLKAE